MKELQHSKTLIWILLIAFLLAWLYALGARTLVPTDEGRYAEMAREMFASGDWITTRLNGIKYFEKPPLQIWATALAFELFGLGEWQARLWTGLCGLLGIALVAQAGRKLWGAGVGFSAAVVLASSLFWIGLGHVNTLDMGLSAMMTLSLASLLIAQRDEAAPRERRNWMLACWAGMALAVLSKGLIGVVLPGAVLVLYTVFARDWSIWRRLHLLPGLLLFFAITTPWFVLVSMRNPEFAWFFFVHEHFQRFTSKIHGRYAPPYYFIPILLVGILPWLSVMAQSLWHARREPGARFQPKLMLSVWTIFLFIFFSISDSKLPSYILPIFPSLALLIALHLHRAGRSAIAACAWLMAAAGAAGVLLWPRVAALAHNAYEQPLYQSYSHAVGAASAIILAGSLAALWLARRRWQAGMLMLACASFACGMFLLIGHQPLGRHAAGLEHLPALEAELAPDTPLYIVGRYEQVLPFYLRRTMTMVQHADELEFGLQQQPELWLPTRALFMQKWIALHDQGKKAVAILSLDAYAEFVRAGMPMRVIAEDPRRVIVADLPAAAAKAGS
jgi:4-amino-4-deoxy-L-arabinose transferase-like glycosyltransferase